MNIDNLDTVIGFAVVALLLSLLITSVVQLAAWSFRLRSGTLLWGIERVLEQLAPGVDVTNLARLVAKHKAINPTTTGSATAIHFDEFVGVLKKIFADAKNQTLAMTYGDVVAAVNAAPTKELTALAATLEAELSQVFPQDAARVKEAAARARSAAVEAGSKVRFWFDTVMDRTTERFVAYTRFITVLAAVLFAFGARIDSLDLIKQLSVKHDVRARLVQMADPVMKEADAVIHQEIATGAGKEAEVIATHVKALQGDLAQTSLTIIPSEAFSLGYYGQHWIGILMSAFFLSLGAPFWFNTLRQLSNLRPILAGKVDAKNAADSASAGG